MNLDDIIEYDDESTNLDFKKEEYRKENYTSLIKDVMSMANSINTETKRIIIGVKHKPGENKEFIGLDKLSDQATLENIIQENIEPNINFKYYSYDFKGIMLGIIEIFNNDDKPYMMKKDYGSLKKGDMWIRKGSRQSRIVREDLDRIFNHRKKISFDNKIIVGFGKELKNEIDIPKSTLKKENFPSSVKKKEIENLIKKLDARYNDSFVDKEKEENLSDLGKLGLTLSKILGEFNDDNKSIRVGYNDFNLPVYKNKQELVDSLRQVRNNYKDNDDYYLYEENSNKINFKIYNDGTEFLEDVKIEFFFNSEIFIISKKIYEKPQSALVLITNLHRSKPNLYPDVYEDEDIIVVESNHENIRHKTLTDIFFEDLRIIVKPKIDIKKSDVNYKISARNLPSPIEGSITVNII